MCVWARFVCDVSHFGSNNKRKCDFWVQKIRKKRKNLKENTRESVANNTRTENLPTPAAAASGTGSGKKKVNKQINSQRAKECRRSVDLLKLEVCSGGEYYISNYDYIVFFAQPLFAKCAFFAQQRKKKKIIQGSRQLQRQRQRISSSQLIYYIFAFCGLFICYYSSFDFASQAHFYTYFNGIETVSLETNRYYFLQSKNITFAR